ncbi:hypothetical protein [Elioraea rosea]|uniref:hypothetical protein n=1 Tax=Elioraea rosea TaxID=2492390 RepID=UPI0013156BFC|nr:hypothetical protein [Elioraea rosea]
MHTPPHGATQRARLRYVFDDAIVSVRLKHTPTLGDVAMVLGVLAGLRADAPRGIDVRLALPAQGDPSAPHSGLVAKGARDDS